MSGGAVRAEVFLPRARGRPGRTSPPWKRSSPPPGRRPETSRPSPFRPGPGRSPACASGCRRRRGSVSGGACRSSPCRPFSPSPIDFRGRGGSSARCRTPAGERCTRPSSAGTAGNSHACPPTWPSLPALLPGRIPDGDVLFCGDGVTPSGRCSGRRWGTARSSSPGTRGFPRVGGGNRRRADLPGRRRRRPPHGRPLLPALLGRGNRFAPVL